MKIKFIFLFFSLFFILSACSGGGDYIKINDARINLIGIADNNDKAYLGLSFKESICANCGMLFPFDGKKIHNFVMRDMMFPLDIIWIDDNKIIKIDKNLQPEGHEVKNVYSSDQPVNNVLEVNAGFSDKKNIEIGDILVYKFENNESNK
ncbi:MAG: DUF192 domain-containing protein [Patescibacteria group bacterium]|jgi:uncharacterized membrane protein (UPF0127 family)|nr:DUF192 domain-containing protein [Patescibacteria group bacterium]